MKPIILLSFSLVVPAAFIGLVTGQSPDRDKRASKNTVKKVLRPIAPVDKLKADNKAPVLSPLVSAAGRNVLLRNELIWVIGGKEQHGWYLYTQLIRRLIGTSHDSDSTGFAAALWSWQEKSGLTPSGVLDEESLYAMISLWQERRLKDRDYPRPEQLVTAPATDFFDPLRPVELRQVERESYDAYKRMVAAAIAEPTLGLALDVDGNLAPAEKYFKILSAFRTREYQELLRRQSPHAGRAGLAINSPHFTGRALDIYVGGDPVDTNDSNRAIQVQTRVYQWLVLNAERFGFRPYYYEPWHWEYATEESTHQSPGVVRKKASP